VKRADLIRHPDAHGCLLFREGAKHSVYFNPVAQRTSIVPRQREVKNPTAIPIRKQLGMPDARFAETRQSIYHDRSIGFAGLNSGDEVVGLSPKC
jgi:mRNA interferase HicA